jgi:hypothetical protein
MDMIEKHLKELSEIAAKSPKTAFSADEVIDIILDIKTDLGRKEVVIDGDELARYFGTKRKTPVSKSQHGFNEGLA